MRCMVFNNRYDDYSYYVHAASMWMERYPNKPEGVQIRPVRRRIPNITLHRLAKSEGGLRDGHPP